MGQDRVERLRGDYDVAVEWRAYELHPEIPPEGMSVTPYLRAYLDRMSGNLERMASEVGLNIVTLDVIPNSRRALEAAEFAREQGEHEAFHAGVFEKLFAQGQDIHRWEVLRALAEEVGLDKDLMQRQTDLGMYSDVVERNVAQARALGITGVPTFIFDDRYAIVGAQPYELFQETMSHLSSIGDKNNSQVSDL